MLFISNLLLLLTHAVGNRDWLTQIVLHCLFYGEVIWFSFERINVNIDLCLVIQPMRTELADELSLRMVLVESIPLHVKYKGNVTFGLPLEKAWNDLISVATAEVDIVSFYWTLTGEDIGVNSTSDIPVSCR